MLALLAPSREAIIVFRDSVASDDPGIGIIDIRTGQIYLMVASQLWDGDHASLATQALGIEDVDEALYLRGFVIGVNDNMWQLVNNSGLNPLGNRMEPELFEALKAVLEPKLGPPRP